MHVDTTLRSGSLPTNRPLTHLAVQGALGTGSSGFVLSASDRIRREVAIKAVRPPNPLGAAINPWAAPLAEEDGCFGSADVQLLRREAKAMMRVDDPGVCSCHEYFFWPSEQQPRLFCMVTQPSAPSSNCSAW